MRIRILIQMLVLLITATSSNWAAKLDTNDHVYSIPLTEAEDVVMGYLEKDEFSIYRQTQTSQSVLLQAEKAQRQWQILLKRHSPLATRIQVEVSKDHDNRQVQGFWRHMESYIHLSTSRPMKPETPSIPLAVRDHHHAVVCIYANGQNSDLQISGFAVDTHGLIVCTGHDLDYNQPVTVRLRDGREVDGRVVKVDNYRDLALIQVNVMLDIVVPLDEGRFKLYNGNKLFAITCAKGGMGGIEPGFIDGPPRRVAGFPLWQVQMHIVHGSSGSPVFDSQGRLAAIVGGRFRGTDSVGFLIPFETLLYFLEKY